MCFFHGIGVAVAASDVLLISHTKGYLQTAGRFAYYMGPMTAMAASFAATTCIATSLRGTDDKLNYVIGAASSGAIFGAWRNSVGAGINAAVILSVAGYLKKKSVDEGWDLFPVIKPEPSPFRKFDFSGLKGKYD